MFDGLNPITPSVNDTQIIDSEVSILVAVYRGFWEDREMELRVDVVQFARARGITTKQALRALEEAQAQCEDRPYAWSSIPEDINKDDLHAAHEAIAKAADTMLEEDKVPPGCGVWFDGLFNRWRWKRPYEDSESTRGILSNTHGATTSKQEAIQQCKDSFIKSKQAI